MNIFLSALVPHKAHPMWVVKAYCPCWSSGGAYCPEAATQRSSNRHQLNSRAEVRRPIEGSPCLPGERGQISWRHLLEEWKGPPVAAWLSWDIAVVVWLPLHPWWPAAQDWAAHDLGLLWGWNGRGTDLNPSKEGQDKNMWENKYRDSY